MQKGNSLSLGAKTWGFIDQPYAGLAAALQHVVQVIYRKTHVVNARAAFGDIFPNGRVIRLPFEKFNKGFAAGHSGDAGSIGVVQGYYWHLENISQERKQFVEGSHSNADMGNAGTAALSFRHVDRSVCLVVEF
jgi:hypothetical protein